LSFLLLKVAKIIKKETIKINKKQIMKNLTKITIISLFSLILGFIGVSTVFASSPSFINLGTSGNYVILSKTGISTTGTTSIIGNIGVSPAAATYITGFSLDLPYYSSFATSPLVTGKVYAPGYADPTPSNITTAVGDMETAYIDGAGRTNPNATELGAGNIGGLTIAPGLYKWSTGLTIPTDVTLSGSANDVWIFQIAQNLDISSATKIILSGGAKADNVYWIVAGQTTIGTTAVFNGNILDQTAIVLNTGATLNGRALAQSAVTLDSNVVTLPSGSSNSATPATPATPAVSSGTSYTYTIPATPAVHAVPVTPSSNSVKTYNFGTVTLKMWSKGESVMELQRFLNAKLNLGLVIDGKLGPKTISIIKKWQKDNGLVEDGLVGNKTKLKMNSMVQ